MNSVLVWILMSLSTQQPALPYAFPSQADCLRASSELNSVNTHHESYRCISMKVVNGVTVPAGQSQFQNPSSRTLRNYQYEQQQFQRWTQSPASGRSH